MLSDVSRDRKAILRKLRVLGENIQFLNCGLEEVRFNSMKPLLDRGFPTLDVVQAGKKKTLVVL